MKKKSLKVLTFAGAGLLALSVGSILASCDTRAEILIWGASEHEDIYMEYAEIFAEENDWDVRFSFAGNGDSGAYSAMSTDVTTGAAVYTFANDMLVNLNRIGALAPLVGDNLTWAQQNHVESALESGKLGDTYYAYPVSADNGFFLYYNESAFKGTSVWDETTNDLKEGFTFQDLYDALDEHTGLVDGYDWSNGLITWPFGDSWYISGMFFGAGGDYSVTYDDDGNQLSAECWFAYTTDESGTDDYTIGLNAAAAMRNSILDIEYDENGTMTDWSINEHYIYSDGSEQPLNDVISMYIADEFNAESPLAAVVCGTWKSAEISEAWGDNARATVLPTLEGLDGNTFPFYTFAGYKLMGVNRYCSYARTSEENLQMLHEFAQYLTGPEVSLARYTSTGLGPSNLTALEDEAVAADYALLALNEQYEVAYRVQDSVPSNYWTPIQNFGSAMYNSLAEGGEDYFDDYTLRRELANLQTSVEAATQ